MTQGRHSLATSVHIDRWLEKIDPGAIQFNPCYLAMKTFLIPEFGGEPFCQGVDKPKPGIMPGLLITGTGITEACD